MFQLFKILILPFILISLLSVGVITTINIDYFFLENNLSERSLTEFFQQVLLLACMFLRELEYYFDMIVHGFWVYPTLLLASLVITYAVKHSENFISSVHLFIQTNAYFNILVGLVIIMIFSRLFGSGTLWKDVMNDDYHHIYKTIIQEGLELFGYVFLFIGSFHQLREVKALNAKNYLLMDAKPLVN